MEDAVDKLLAGLVVCANEEKVFKEVRQAIDEGKVKKKKPPE
ncbi:hypothetical protein ACF3DV_02300 [Chlorogloeopsis fritschii PCC 9212]|nr:hypothetical protein [Chlorogloeopsis fritschii]